MTRTTPKTPFRRRWLAPSFWLDWLAVSDPDLSLFRAGARPLLAVALTTVLLAGFASLSGIPLATMIVGIVLAMLSTVQATDLPVAEQRPIIAGLVLPAIGGLILGTLLIQQPWVAQLGLLAVTFIAIFIRRYGARGLAFGQIGFMGYFFALFFPLPTSALPPLSFSIVVGVGIAYLTRFVFLPDNHASSLQWSLKRMPLVLGMLLATVSDGLLQPHGWGGQEEIALREARRRVNRVAIALDDHLTDESAATVAPGLTADELRERIFELELALDYVASRARVLASARQVPSTVRLEALVEGPASDADDLPTRLAAARSLQLARRLLRAGRGHPDPHPPPELATSLADLLGALGRLSLPGTPGRKPAALPVVAPLEAVPAKGMQLSTRQAIQAAIAVGLSVVAGSALSPGRWTWAAIGAYIMFIRATTLGETLSRGWHRITGTLAGVGAGVVIASLVTGHEGVELTVAGLAIFVGFYLVKVFYAGLVFGITLAFAILYVMLGRYSPAIMLLRLEETLVGCVVGGLVAALVLPAPTREKVDVTLARLLRELEDLLREAAASNLVRTPVVIERSREVDRTMQALREAAKPLSIGLFGLTIRDGSERVHLADRVVLCLRHLAGSLEATPLDPAACRELAARFGRVEAWAESLAGALEGSAASPLPRKLVPAPRPVGPRTAYYWLARLEDALGGLEAAVTKQNLRG